MHPIPKLKCFTSHLAVVFAQSIEARYSVEIAEVVGAAPTGAPTTSEWSTSLLPANVWLILGFDSTFAISVLKNYMKIQDDFTFPAMNSIQERLPPSYPFLLPVPQMVFRSNLKFYQNLQCSGLKCAQLIPMKFCTHHDSVIAMMCANFIAISQICHGQEHYKVSSNFKFNNLPFVGEAPEYWCSAAAVYLPPASIPPDTSLPTASVGSPWNAIMKHPGAYFKFLSNFHGCMSAICK